MAKKPKVKTREDHLVETIRNATNLIADACRDKAGDVDYGDALTIAVHTLSVVMDATTKTRDEMLSLYFATIIRLRTATNYLFEKQAKRPASKPKPKRKAKRPARKVRA